MKKSLIYLASVATLFATACTSYEMDMPENPDQPEVGKPVPTQVIYEANPRFFATSDCLNALSNQLSRINSLGCDILWIMPVCEPGTDATSIGSPYCIKNYTAINPQYGTIADLKNLVDKAHGMGMTVILDWIANHTSFDNAWITEHPDWFIRDATGNIVSPQGWNDVAQLNWNDASVAPQIEAAMAEAMEFWVAQAGIDGFRCDYANGLPYAAWQAIIDQINAKYSGLMWLAETENTNYYNYGFDMIYDWNSAPTISSAFTGGKPSGVVQEGVSAWNLVPEGKSILRYAFNHDTASEQPIDSYYGSVDAIPAAYVCAAFLNGTPLIYSSMDATGLSGTQSFFNYTTLTFSDEITPVYAAINSAFKATADVRRGECADFSNTDVVCFTYSIPGQTLLVAVNTTGSEQNIVSPIELRNSTMTDLLTGSATQVPLEITLAPYGYTFLMN